MSDPILNNIRETNNLAELQTVVKGFSRDAKKSHLNAITKQAILLAKRDAKLNLVETRDRFKSINDLLPTVKKGHGIIGRIASRIFPSRERTLEKLNNEIDESKVAKPKLYEKLEKLQSQIDMSHEAKAQGLPPLLFAKKMKFLAQVDPHLANKKATHSLAHQIERLEEPLTKEQIHDVKRNLVTVLQELGINNPALSWESLEMKVKQYPRLMSRQAEALASIEMLKAAEPKSKGFVPLTRQELEAMVKEEIQRKQERFPAEHLPIQDLNSRTSLEALRKDFDEVKMSRGIFTTHALINYKPTNIEKAQVALEAWPDAATFSENIQLLIEGYERDFSKDIVALIRLDTADLDNRLAVIKQVSNALFEMGYPEEALKIFTVAKAIVGELDENGLSEDFRGFLAAQRARSE